MATKQEEYLAQGGTLRNGQIPTEYAPTEISPGVFGPINSTSMTPTVTTPFQIPTPATAFPVAGLDATPPLAPTQPEIQASDLTTRLQQLNERLIGQSFARSQAEITAGLPALQKTQTDLSSQLRALQDEALALQNRYNLTIPNQQVLEGEGRRSVGQIQALTDRERRSLQIQQGDIATRALGISSLLEASRGNLAMAQQQVDRAVSEKYQPILEEIAVKQANLQLVLQSPAYSLAERNRAEQQKAIQQQQAEEVQRKMAEEEDIKKLAVTATKYGIPGNVLSDIQNARSFKDALVLAGPYMVDPASKLELEGAVLNNTLKKEQIKKAQYEFSLLGKYGGMSPKEYSAYLKEERATIKAEQDAIERARLEGEAIGEKITLLDSVINSNAIDSVVGPSFVSRAATAPVGVVGRFLAGAIPGAIAGSLVPGIGTTIGGLVTGTALALQGSKDYFTGSADKLVGQTEQFISKEFLQSLIDVKAQGATFGALQKAEQDALTEAATFIGQRRICGGEKRGVCKEGSKVTGYDMAEADFKKELGTIQEMAQIAFERATGKTFTEDEQVIWSALEESQQELIFNPAY